MVDLRSYDKVDGRRAPQHFFAFGLGDAACNRHDRIEPGAGARFFEPAKAADPAKK